ncbi:MFS transporter [Streptomyces canus]|uniref:MFS transporter n=1 Tax=Streptomyces canus TaxID=58343 RepID=UPI0038708EBA|nr:MFS transporter [Streptomyces canus]
MSRTERLPALLREQSFRRYWTGHTVSLFGDQITQIALPLLAVLALDAGATQMGWLTAAGLLPSLLFSVHAGVWADRSGRRRHMMITTDLGRALALVSLPVAWAMGWLDLGQLYAVAFMVGTLSVLFDVCNAALFISLVPTERYVEGNSLLNGSRAMSFMVGTSAGGALVQLLSAPIALLADTTSYLTSAWQLSRIHSTEPPAAARAKGDLMAGFRYLIRSRVLRSYYGAVTTLNLFNFAFQAIFVLYATTELGLSPGLLGAVLGSGAVGAVIGSLLTGRIVRRIGIGRATFLGLFAFPAPLVLVPLAQGSVPLTAMCLFLAEFGSGFGVMVLDISGGSLTASLIPDTLRSRVAGASRLCNYGIRPIGALAGGWLGAAIGLRPTLWIATLGALLGLTWVLPSRILLRTITPKLSHSEAQPHRTP